MRSMSSTAKVWVDKNTRVICQGFTGKQVREMMLLLWEVERRDLQCGSEQSVGEAY